jgi:hypothetical protein
MTHITSRIIREEHSALAAMLRSMLLLLLQHRNQGTLAQTLSHSAWASPLTC